MQKDITIGGQVVSLSANGATPIRFKMIFGEDIMVVFNQTEKGKRDDGELVDLTAKLAFVMNKQATCSKEELSKLSYKDYVDWLEQFGSMDLPKASNDIITFYVGDSTGDSKPKKEDGQQSEN